MTALGPQHVAELHASMIDDQVRDARGYRTLGPESRQTLVDARCPKWAVREDTAFPGLFIPMHDTRGAYIGFQFKPAQPQTKPGMDKPSKYASPAGMHNRLDVNPLVRHLVADPGVPLWITEGMKKADALASRGRAVIGMTGVWNWRREDRMLADWEDVPLRGRTVIVCFDADTATNPQVRNAMRRLVSWLRNKTGQDGRVYYLVVPGKVGDTPVKGVDDFFAAGGDDGALKAAATERAPAPPVDRDAAFTDAFLTDTVCAEALSGQFLYARGLGWMRYDGMRWDYTDESQIIEEVRVWAKAHWDDVVDEYKQDQSRDVDARVKGWKQVLTSGRLKALASLARGPLHAEASEFDAHPDLINTPNGVVDLRTGELLEPDPAYRFTRMTGVPYDPDATDPDFEAALTALPEDVRDWYQLRAGQAFTGHTPTDDLMIVQQGGGKNGKSTLAVPLVRAAGSYYVLVSDRVILGNADQHTTEMMDLKGARYALMEETPEARTLNVQQLKKVVGTPEITARRIRQDPVTFRCSHSLFVNTNFTPAVVEADLATWRRLALVRFPYTFRSRAEDVTGPLDRLGDDSLRDRCLLLDGPPTAALAWLVRGAVRWYAQGRIFGPHPRRVQADTRAWRTEGDLLLQFSQERLEYGPGMDVKSGDVYQAFTEWLVVQGHQRWSQKTFKARFSGHDLIADMHVSERRDRARGVLWEGVRLVPSAQLLMDQNGSNPYAG